ncbi:hypothetical protein FRB96_005310 [Tulasnella sp. 330]|nr:hypothetical protein FRB96_005310 [Tulasnella sp. 330]
MSDPRKINDNNPATMTGYCVFDVEKWNLSKNWSVTVSINSTDTINWWQTIWSINDPNFKNSLVFLSRGRIDQGEGGHIMLQVTDITGVGKILMSKVNVQNGFPTSVTVTRDDKGFTLNVSDDPNPPVMDVKTPKQLTPALQLLIGGRKLTVDNGAFRDQFFGQIVNPRVSEVSKALSVAFGSFYCILLTGIHHSHKLD